MKNKMKSDVLFSYEDRENKCSQLSRIYEYNSACKSVLLNVFEGEREI